MRAWMTPLVAVALSAATASAQAPRFPDDADRVAVPMRVLRAGEVLSENGRLFSAGEPPS